MPVGTATSYNVNTNVAIDTTTPLDDKGFAVRYDSSTRPLTCSRWLT